MLQRRAFLKSGALALFGTGMAGGIPAFVARAAQSQKQQMLFGKTKTLVCIFQRGAMDGLMAVSPFADPALAKARPSLYMSPLAAQGGLLDLDGKFGLHPALSALHPYFLDKRLAIVHGVGSPNTTRSHFDAQDYMESGTPFKKSTTSGWMNRAVGLTGHEGSPFRAVSLTNAMPRSLYGPADALAIANLNDFAIQFRGNPLATQLASKSFEDLYDQTSNQLLSRTGKESVEAMKMLSPALLKKYQPAPGVTYPNSPLGNALRQIAQLVKMDLGLELAFAESGGWDTHVAQGTNNGSFARNLTDFSTAIAAFWQDLGGLQDQVSLMTMTEFGRTVHQNGTGGTDHGRASCLFVLGNGVLGGQVQHHMKSLQPEELEAGRDLPVTTDFRAVFSGVANGHLGIQNNGVLFPDWNGQPLALVR